MTLSDASLSWRAMLLTRAWPRQAIVAAFDEWQRRRHFPDLVALPGVARADYLRTVETGLPQILLGTGNRVAIYWSAEIDQLFTFLTDPGLVAAVQDGSQFFADFNELDGDVYTGNIYELDEPRPRSRPGSPDVGRRVCIERFEVPADATGEFDEWLRTEHIPGLEQSADVISVRTGTALRVDVPVPYYNSPGSHLVYAVLDDHEPISVQGDRIVPVLGTTQQWDRRFGYVRREIVELEFTRPGVVGG